MTNATSYIIEHYIGTEWRPTRHSFANRQEAVRAFAEHYAASPDGIYRLISRTVLMVHGL